MEWRMIKDRLLPIFLSLFGVILFDSCSLSQKSKQDDVKSMSSDEIYESYQSKIDQPEFLSANMRIKLTTKSSKKSFSARLRLEKDKKIWVNMSFLGISFARALVTPDSVHLYERQNDSFFEGDFSYISKLLGADLDFYQLQSLILGNSIFELNTSQFKSSISNKSYILEYKNNRKLSSLGKNNGDYIKRFWFDVVSSTGPKILLLAIVRANPVWSILPISLNH
jgi:hypothetical protein